MHHTHKLEHVSGLGVQDFARINAAGKAGILLSALSATEETTLSMQKVQILATASNIDPIFALPRLLELLQARGLIDVERTGVSVLGVTTPVVMHHTAGVYEDLGATTLESAALELSELVSDSPWRESETKIYLGDTFKLTDSQTTMLLENSESIGFVDFENLGGDKVYFNGNLFRRGQIAKTQAVLNSLTEQEERLVGEVDEMLKSFGCVPLDDVVRILGQQLFEKLNAISMYDVNVVNNDLEDTAFVTRPAAFAKYGSPLVEDALDLSKALVSSLTYGMTRSSLSRGRIVMIERLMNALIDGRWVGAAEAIGQDYRALELKNVVEVRADPPRGYSMRLLKKDVGLVALAVIKAGDASDTVLNLPGATVTGYVAPETNREIARRQQQQPSKRATRDMVMALRTGSVLL